MTSNLEEDSSPEQQSDSPSDHAAERGAPQPPQKPEPSDSSPDSNDNDFLISPSDEEMRASIRAGFHNAARDNTVFGDFITQNHVFLSPTAGSSKQPVDTTDLYDTLKSRYAPHHEFDLVQTRLRSKRIAVVTGLAASGRMALSVVALGGLPCPRVVALPSADTLDHLTDLITHEVAAEGSCGVIAHNIPRQITRLLTQDHLDQIAATARKHQSWVVLTTTLENEDDSFCTPSAIHITDPPAAVLAKSALGSRLTRKNQALCAEVLKLLDRATYDDAQRLASLIQGGETSPHTLLGRVSHGANRQAIDDWLASKPAITELNQVVVALCASRLSLSWVDKQARSLNALHDLSEDSFPAESGILEVPGGGFLDVENQESKTYYGAASEQVITVRPGYSRELLLHHLWQRISPRQKEILSAWMVLVPMTPAVVDSLSTAVGTILAYDPRFIEREILRKWLRRKDSMGGIAAGAALASAIVENASSRVALDIAMSWTSKHATVAQKYVGVHALVVSVVPWTTDSAMFDRVWEASSDQRIQVMANLGLAFALTDREIHGEARATMAKVLFKHIKSKNIAARERAGLIVACAVNEAFETPGLLHTEGERTTPEVVLVFALWKSLADSVTLRPLFRASIHDLCRAVHDERLALATATIILKKIIRLSEQKPSQVDLRKVIISSCRTAPKDLHKSAQALKNSITSTTKGLLFS